MGERSWWGWGDASEQLGDADVRGLGAMVAERFGIEPPELVEVPGVPDVPEPATAVPSSLEDLASADARDRVRHGRGNAFRDVVRVLHGRLPRVPDLVLRPATAADVARALEWCTDRGVVCIPFGGGTSVVGGVEAPADPRPVVSLDLERLGRVREVDAVSRSAYVEGGALGPRIEDQLRPHGLTLRHFPQSWEFSSLGGWIATRAAGHYATGPTHIDDLTEAVDAVTPTGTWTGRRLPASGAGPSPDGLWLGSEGTLGVVTGAWMRVQARPVFRSQATVRFPTLEAGAGALRELAQSGLAPANCRLLDPAEAALSGAADGSVAVLVLGFESADHPQHPVMQRALELCSDHGGSAPDGARHRQGDRTGTAEGGAGEWRRTFLRAPYLRDALVRLGMVVETFETAVTWDAFDAVVGALRETARATTERLCGAAEITVRVTHAYPDGAAPYLTVIAPGRGADTVAVWDEVKAAVSEVILSTGATITHHHAVGRDHVPWYVGERPTSHGRALRAVKRELDPAGVMNPGVLGL